MATLAKMVAGGLQQNIQLWRYGSVIYIMIKRVFTVGPGLLGIMGLVSAA